MSNLTLEVPLGQVSFGQVSTSICRELYRRGLEPNIFVIGNVDLSTQKPDKDFEVWLNSCISKATKSFSRDHPCFRLWHFNQSQSSVGKNTTLYTFFECDGPTPEEIQIAKNQKKVLVSCKYTETTFKDYGVDNIATVPLGFDSHNFAQKDKQYFTDGRISFNLGGKIEITRKKTAQILQAWVKKFGNDRRYFLNAAIFNPFIKPEDQQNMIGRILEGKRYFNVQSLGFMPTNEIYCDYLNSGDIAIGMGTESWDIPLFTSIALGKHAIALNVAGHKEYCTDDNCVIVNPSGKSPAYDGIFFHPNQPYNQGNFFDYNSDEFIAACEKAITRVEKSRVNTEGLKLQEQFTWTKTVDGVLAELGI